MKNSKGITYHFNKDQVKAYAKLSAKEKLIWLEDINRLTLKTLSNEELEFRRKLLDGEA